MLIHRVTNCRTMEPLGVRAHPQPYIQEYIQRASLTAARQKESGGVGFGIIHHLKDRADVIINYECWGRLQYGVSIPTPESKAFSGDDLQSCDLGVVARLRQCGVCAEAAQFSLVYKGDNKPMYDCLNYTSSEVTSS